jgi:hypothetical protein
LTAPGQGGARELEESLDLAAPPSGPGCADCEQNEGWWVHLRRCAQCGHVGCCDTSPSQHATAHFRESGHRLMRSYEPGEDWYWDYVSEQSFSGPDLAPPVAHPEDQPTPGPTGRVPVNWRELIH